MTDVISAPLGVVASEVPAAGGVPDVRIRGLDVAYREGERTYPALAGVDLHLRPGEFVVVAGANGSGKTTLCRVLAGFIPEFLDADVSGSVEFDDRSVLGVSATDRVGIVGYVFDAPHDQLTGAARTVQEEVAFGLENLGVPREAMRVRVADALRTVGITHLADRHPWSLSGGQTQRLALASVLALRPSILVLDEPTSQLDPLGAAEVVDTVLRLNRSGLTILYVTHDLEPVLEAADRLVVLHDGLVVVDGSAREALAAIAEGAGVVTVPVAIEVARSIAERRGDASAADVPLTVEACIAGLRVMSSGPERRTVVDATPPEVPTVDTPIVALEHVSFTYPSGTQALRDVTLAFGGGRVCVVGQNGSGKSTLMRHLNGLLRPTAGRVLMFGDDTAGRKVHDLARTVGVAFQNPDDQLFGRTVRDEVAFGARSLGLDEGDVEARVIEALDLLDLADVAVRRPLELGLAARKRVIAASIVAMGCPVVVLDEPTSAQDASGTAAIERTVGRVVASGRTAVIVSHDMEFVARTADRVVVMHDGGVLLDGPPTEVLAQADTLARTSVRPPAVVRIGLGLGLTPPPLSIAGLVAHVAPGLRPTAIGGSPDGGP